MTYRTVVVLVASAILFVTLACSAADLSIGPGRTVRGSGTVIEESRPMDDVTSVNLATIGTLHIEQGSEVALRISAEDNILPLLKTDVRAGVLTIETEPGTNIRTTRPIDYYLTVVDLREVGLSSAGDGEAGDLDLEDFTIRVSSSGKFTMGDLTCQDLTVRASSSGKVEIDSAEGAALDVELSSSGDLTIGAGDFQSQTVRLSSSGSYHGQNVRTSEATLRLSSSGSATVWVEDTLDARLSSSGGVRYAGTPSVTSDASSSGTVKPLND
ncbi:MAG: DUF2807 domain-containing protein [Anaerolineae bacterium]|nr:DUF2807 domain-containing protein [Anaerolineae bacterium]